MKLATFILFFYSFVSFAQGISTITNLSDSINETSGLIFYKGKLITHNDSGDEALLYEIDSLNGEITRTVFVANAVNNDWEDICFDKNYIYIGDFGNNAGMRTDLKIYRIEIHDYLLSDTVFAEAINFAYSDQIDFSNQMYATNFDAEALICIEDSLYIFTKNWLDFKCNVYTLSKNPGNYLINQTDNLITDGLITGADFNTFSNKLILCGHSFINPFIVQIEQFQEGLFSSGNSYKIELEVNESIQIEAISTLSNNQYYLTSELNTSGASSLYRLNTESLNIEDINFSRSFISPNLTRDYININRADIRLVHIYNSNGVLVMYSDKNTINVSNLTAGLYVVSLSHSNTKISYHKLIIE